MPFSGFGTGTPGLGRMVKVAATGTAGTLVHLHKTASPFQRVRIEAVNTTTTAKLLTIEWAGVSDPDDLIKINLAPQRGPVLICDWLIERGKKIGAFAATANVIVLYCEVHDVR